VSSASFPVDLNLQLCVRDSCVPLSVLVQLRKRFPACAGRHGRFVYGVAGLGLGDASGVFEPDGHISWLTESAYQAVVLCDVECVWRICEIQ
jgi:hypothetical protein